MNSAVGWRAAMTAALYGGNGFFRAGAGPAAHFRTSVHASPLFARAVLRLIGQIDEALGHPATFDVVDVGAGRGELLTALHQALATQAQSPRHHAVAAENASDPSAWWPATTAPSTGEVPPLAERVRLVGVEVAGRPVGLSDDIGWVAVVPDGIAGLLIATEWLDNVPLDVAEVDSDGTARRVLVDPGGSESVGGGESLGDPVDVADLFWLARWWPLDGEPTGTRAEIGWPRDAAWADAVRAVHRGCALAVDYGHLRAARPPFGTLTGYREGRQVHPVPDGRGDVTAHVAMDAVAAAAGTPYTLRSQREALRALGVDGARPPLELATRDPAGYVQALSVAAAAAELTDPAGLGGHWWLLHEVGIDARGTIVA